MTQTDTPMATAWTEGPWEAFESTINPGVWYVGSPHFGLLRTDSSSHPKADATLAAAAPALAVALQDLLDAIGTHDPEWAWQERQNARAALSKAGAA